MIPPYKLRELSMAFDFWAVTCPKEALKVFGDIGMHRFNPNTEDALGYLESAKESLNLMEPSPATESVRIMPDVIYEALMEWRPDA